MSAVSFTSVPLVFQVENAGAFANGNFSRLHKCDVLCGAAGAAANLTAFAVDASVDHERPSVGQSFGGPTALFTCAYQRYEWSGAAGFEWNIAVRRFGGGLVFGDYMLDDGAPDRHEMAPRVAGRDTKEFIVYTASTVAESIAKPGGANGHRIRGTRVDWS